MELFNFAIPEFKLHTRELRVEISKFFAEIFSDILLLLFVKVLFMMKVEVLTLLRLCMERRGGKKGTGLEDEVGMGVGVEAGVGAGGGEGTEGVGERVGAEEEVDESGVGAEPEVGTKEGVGAGPGVDTEARVGAEVEKGIWIEGRKVGVKISCLMAGSSSTRN